MHSFFKCVLNCSSCNGGKIQRDRLQSHLKVHWISGWLVDMRAEAVRTVGVANEAGKGAKPALDDNDTEGEKDAGDS